MELTANAKLVLERRYLRKEDGMLVETPEEMFRRVAAAIARVDGDLYGADDAAVMDLEKRFYEAMSGLDFLPNSPTLMNAGRDLGQLSACFVLPVEDSMESIFETLKMAALIHQSGGGTGFSFSRLRPRNDIVRTTGGMASGPISFIRVFDAATNSVKQGGMRRGANMGILRVDHPDIMEFITCKQDDSEIRNFNLSVALTDEFMDALAHDAEYDLINPRTGEPAGSMKAADVFDLIVKMAWQNGEPGVVFIDRMNAANPTPLAGNIESTNPCGEQPLLPQESCNLLSVNLKHMVADGGVDYDKLERTVRLGVHFLDNVIDANAYPFESIGAKTRANRKIGLGIMGWADMLAELETPYNSEEALSLAEEIMSFINVTSMDASSELAAARGSFPNFKGSIYDKEGGRPMRNATTTTIAPTGTISIIAGVSGGIEPFFSIAMTRHVMDNDDLFEVNGTFEAIGAREGFCSHEVIARVAENGSAAGIEEIPEKWRRVFVTAHEIEPDWHVRMQAAFQKHTHNAVSKTVNFQGDASEEDVRKVYILAYESGCKGITIYRDGSRESQVLTRGNSEKAPVMSPSSGPDGFWGRIIPIPRPGRLSGSTEVLETPMGKLFITLNVMERHPVELFAQIGKAGSDVGAFTEAVARLISLALRSGIAPEEVVKQLIGIGGSRSVGFGPKRILSVPDAIGKYIGDFLKAEENHAQEAEEVSPEGQSSFSFMHCNLCPSCGINAIVHVEGCSKCLACGYSEC